MSELFAALFLIVFVLLLIYVVKKLLDSDRKSSMYRKFIVIPIRNNMTDIAKMIKAVYWDNKFNDADESEILIYPAEEPDENCLAELKGLYDELEGMKIIRQNKLEDYINSNV